MQKVNLNSQDIYLSSENFRAEVLFDEKKFNLISIRTSSKREKLTLKNAAFVFVQNGEVVFDYEKNKLKLTKGMYGALRFSSEIVVLPNTRVIFVTVNSLKVLNNIGGPVERSGRLSYINGCSDTLLLSPSRLGEPCLNLLHFPKNTKQTMHYHPSFRFGIVASGKGESVSDTGIFKLKPGDVFFIPSNLNHKFNTTSDNLNVIAFHPDSDWGPTDEVHPMKNRTWFKK